MGRAKLSKIIFPHASRHLSQQSQLRTSKSVAYHLAFGVREEQSNYVLKSVYNLRAVGIAKVSKTLFYTFVKPFVCR